MKNVIKYPGLSCLLGIGCFAILLSASLLAYGSSDSIHVQIRGTIFATSCQVDIPQDVNLGQISRQDLSVPGGNSSTMVVLLKLSQCSPEVSQATVSFTGSPYTADPAFSSAIYANEASGGATDIGLQLFNLDGNALVNLANGVNYSFPVQTTTHAGVLSIGARMYSPHGTPTAGDFKAAVTVNFTYQ